MQIYVNQTQLWPAPNHPAQCWSHCNSTRRRWEASRSRNSPRVTERHSSSRHL